MNVAGFSLAPAMLSVVESDGRYTWVNDVVLQYFGLSAADITSDDLRRRVVHPMIFRGQERKGKGASPAACHLNTKTGYAGIDGQYRWVLVRYRPLKDAAGRVVRGMAAQPVSGTESGLKKLCSAAKLIWRKRKG